MSQPELVPISHKYACTGYSINGHKPPNHACQMLSMSNTPFHKFNFYPGPSGDFLTC